ncbi:MAG: D-aminoacyl-tRNA deacylase [Actinomycetota bacterium]|nr:D-aminoacyl-tRNA deacylase [Actinomycetota bacterium]
MRAVVQRVIEARVRVDDEVIGRIGPGLFVLVGVTHGDTPAVSRSIASRLWHLRIFDDEAGVMNHPVSDVGGQVLVVSQFTLYGDTSRGRRPSWAAAAPAAEAKPMVDEVMAELRRLGATVATGRFGEQMLVEIVNDGPVTVLVEA